MPNVKIIAISGVKQSGKNTFADMLKEEIVGRGVPCKCFGFADAVKWSVARIFMPKCTMEEAVRWCDAGKEDPDFELGWDVYSGQMQKVTLRQSLQHMGTEVGQQIFWPSFWVDLLVPMTSDHNQQHNSISIYNNMPDGGYAIITDMRFQHELDRMIDHDAYKIKMSCKRAFRYDSHVSEAGLPGELFDVVVENNGTLDELRESAKAIVNYEL